MDIKTSTITPGLHKTLGDPGPVQPGRPGGPPVSRPIPAGQEMAALFSAPSDGSAPPLPPPIIPQRSDMNRAATLLDEMMILFHQMSSDSKRVHSEASWQQMHQAKDQSLQGADLKQDAATKMMIMGFVSMGIGIAGAALSVAAPVVSLGAGLLSAGTSAGAEAAKEAGKEVGKAVVQEVVKNISEKIAQKVAAEVMTAATEEAAKAAAEKVAAEIAKEVAKEVGQEVAKQVGQEVAKATSEKMSAEVAKAVGQQIGQEVAKELGQEVAKSVASEVSKQAGTHVGTAMTDKLTQEVGQAVTKEVAKSVTKETTKGIVGALGHSMARTVAMQFFSNPQTARLVTDSGGQTTQSFGQSDIQSTQAEGDRMGARAQATMGDKQRSDQFSEDFRELMKKMNQLINDLLAAQNQSEAAAAKA